MGRVREIRWIPVGAGWLAIWHRPGLKALPLLQETGCEHVLTLLSEREGAHEIGDGVRKAGMEWTWLPLPNARWSEGKKKDLILSAIPDLSEVLDRGAHLLIHCSAGIHRTGVVTYILLRRRGHDEQEALSLIARMRPHTREGLRREDIEWGNEVIN
ncbi:MAG: tyrosine-protein phosphatase [Acidobacteriota bacterium]|nr:tyrosine-protein phosphatase [Acidobacteriota bacterium]